MTTRLETPPDTFWPHAVLIALWIGGGLGAIAGALFGAAAVAVVFVLIALDVAYIELPKLWTRDGN